MDAEHKKDKLTPHEMTFRVGWTRGTIRPKNDRRHGQDNEAGAYTEKLYGEQAGQPRRAENEPVSSAARCREFTYRGLHRKSFAERVVWRSLPEVPACWTTPLLWAAPVIGFALTYALVLALTRAP